jgi:hypothetical protein
MAKKESFDPKDREFLFSRTALDEFVECPRCFYFSRRLGHARPGGGMSGLPGAVEKLMRQELDGYRARHEQHPVMADLPGDLIPFDHPSLGDWRKSKPGIRLAHAGSGFLLSGAPDDVWYSRETEELHIVDYKTTSSDDGATLETDWAPKYMRQVSFYQYLLSGIGHPASRVAYFLFAKADKEADAYGGIVRFDSIVRPYEVDTSWIEGALLGARACLEADAPPAPTEDCKWCAWAAAVTTDDGGAA